jgi:hypothetical protein
MLKLVSYHDQGKKNIKYISNESAEENIKYEKTDIPTE